MQLKNSTNQTSDNKPYTLGLHFGVPAVNALEFNTFVRDRLRGRKLENLTAKELRRVAQKLENIALGYRQSVAPLEADAVKLRILPDEIDPPALLEGGTNK